MWAAGGVLFAAVEAPPPAGVSDSLIVTIGGIVVAAIGALGLVLAEVVRNRPGRTSPAPAVISDTPLGERVAVLEDWRKTVNEADDVYDRAVYRMTGDVEDVVHWLDRHYPDWRP